MSAPPEWCGKLIVHRWQADNTFVRSSGLSIKRRPANILTLPPLHELICIESLSPEADVMNRDRTTWNAERLAGQKGSAYQKAPWFEQANSKLSLVSRVETG